MNSSALKSQPNAEMGPALLNLERIAIPAPWIAETAVEMEQDTQKNRKRKKARVLDSEGIRRRNLAQQQRVKEQRKAADELRAEVSKVLTRRGHPAGSIKSMSRTVIMRHAADLLSRINLHDEGCRPGETRIQRQAHPIETFNWTSDRAMR